MGDAVWNALGAMLLAWWPIWEDLAFGIMAMRNILVVIVTKAD